MVLDFVQSHCTNLAIKSLRDLPFVNQIENLLQSLHNNFACSPKWHNEFVKLAKVLDTKGVKNSVTSKD
jgi:hypothetical protein